MPVLTDEEVNALPPNARVLEIGCGQNRRFKNSVTLDVNPLSVADVIHNLDEFPYPLPDNEFDLVIAEHVLEHLSDVIKTMEELHRITKPGGRICVQVPHFSCCDFFTDPTHKHAFSSRSFDYFMPESYLNQFHYSPVTFRNRKTEIVFLGNNPLWKLWSRMVNRHQLGYERKYAFIVPAQFINFDLEVAK